MRSVEVWGLSMGILPGCFALILYQGGSVLPMLRIGKRFRCAKSCLLVPGWLLLFALVFMPVLFRVFSQELFSDFFYLSSVN